jgi:LuxR family maltose regulon positive regulatory protein
MTLPAAALSSPAWTRHNPPTRQPSTLERAALVAQLEDIVARHPITLVTAPSGFGKTTLVTVWADQTPQIVAWLALDPLEARSVDGAIVAALESVLPHDRITTFTLESESETESLDRRRRLEEILEATAEPVVLVIDDAQRANASLESGLLGSLLASAPRSLKVVLVGTTALELRMPRFILSNPDAVVGAEVLAFDAPEVHELAAEMASSADAAAVHVDTAGWPIAVRLALLAKRTSRGSAPQRTAGLMHEYVRDVVLSGLDPDLARFVIEAAVCDELTPRLAAELTGRTDAGAMLEKCRRLGLFLDRHDGPAGPQYRWHSLFARHCRELLAEEEASRLAELRGRAATLLAEARPLDAIALYFELDDAEAAAHVLLDSWVGLIVGNSAAAVDRVCMSLPASIAERPAIQLIRACARDVLGEHRSARELYESVRATASVDEAHAIVAELASLFFIDDREQVAAALASVRARLASMRVGSPSEHAAITFVVGWTEMRSRLNPERTIETLEAAAREAQAIGDRALTRRSLEFLAYGLSWGGRIAASRSLLESLADEEPDVSSWVSYVGGSGAVASGMIAYWAHDLVRAEQEFRRVIAFSSTRSTFADLARVLLAATAAATGDSRQCRRAALELQFLPPAEVQGIAWPIFRQVVVALLEEAVGHPERALQIARSLADEPSMPVVAVLVAGIMRRAGAYADALKVLRQQKAYMGVSYVRAALLITSALAHWTSGRQDAAHELCEEAIALGERETIRLPFTEGDPELRALLSAHIPLGTQHEEFLLSCLRPGATSSALGLLSERERDVFEQLRTTLTTIEIAERLGVSVNTVKTHQRSIYRKLGVTSRREALRQYT